MPVYQVEIGLDCGDLWVEVTADEDASEDELQSLAEDSIAIDLMSAKLREVVRLS